MENEQYVEYRNRVGWLYVVVQFVLIAFLILFPTGDSWPTPSWVIWGSRILSGIGLLIMAISAAGLGSSLTPTPVPRANSVLNTTGFYRFVRHPIYSGLLLFLIGIVLSASSWPHAGVGLIVVIFFNQKARWEEVQLCERYENYLEYMSQTPRFIPRW